jgi:amylosucrase
MPGPWRRSPATPATWTTSTPSPTAAEPDAYEATLPEVFPDFAPGNFTWEPSMGRWVWTTFHAYQWDLNWSNPEVFLEVIGIMGDLANRGIDVFRMDAVAFMWKRLGTDCQNQPEVHDLLQALRACSKIATPAVAHKAEAIVSPHDLIHYFGTGRRYGKVANIAYHNSLMVQTWSALASRDARLMTRTLGAFPPTPPSIAWGCYVRCHDDIGWAVTDEDAAAVGWSGPAHRHFLSDFYSGQFPGTFARGAVFQFNPATGDRRISGTCASLAGLEGALEAGEAGDGDDGDRTHPVGPCPGLRLRWHPAAVHGRRAGHAQRPRYLHDPEHRADNRWLHRPPMDWLAADRRHLPDTVEARLFGGLVKILRARSRTPHLHAQTPSEVLDLGHPRVFAQLRRHPLGPLLALYNVADDTATLDTAVFETLGLRQPYDQLEGRFVDVGGGPLTLRPYDRLWLT